MPHGLPRKIRLAFILQTVLASLAILMGGYLVSLVIKHGLVRSVLEDEAGHYWQLYEASSAQPPPNTANIRGYLVPSGRSNLSLPDNLRPLAPGYHELADDNQLVLVDQRESGRLYLVFMRSQAERMAFWFGIVPVLLILLAIYAVSWIPTGRPSGWFRRSTGWRAASPIGTRAIPTWKNWPPRACRRTSRARPVNWPRPCIRWACGYATTWPASATSPAMPAMSCARH